MRYLLRTDVSSETVLEQLAQAAYQVVEGNIPDSVAEDTRVGFYVAFHQILADSLVRIEQCGTLPACEDLREVHPFAGAGLATTAARARV